jgi:hypothetical protein
MAKRLAKRETDAVKEVPGFAIVRIDSFQDSDETRFTVKAVV